MGTADARILAALRAAPEGVSPADLARAAALPAETLSARLGALREAGFGLESAAGNLLRLTTSPDRLVADDLWARLNLPAPDPLLREILCFAETGSTNDLALRLAREGVPGGVLVLTEAQTAGRGRFGRPWQSAPGLGLWLSWLVQPPWPRAQWPRLALWVAVGLARALEREAGVQVGLKWPNDLQIHGRKLGGILIETTTAAPGAVVIGVGLNVHHQREDFPPELVEKATSLRAETGRTLSRPELLTSLLRQWRADWPGFEEEWPATVAEAERRSVLRGRRVEARVQGALCRGIAESLDGEGRLLLRTESGEQMTLHAGEVTLQPA